MATRRLTSKDLAAHIDPSGPETGSAQERIKYWTRLGLLPVIGVRHRGKGRWVEYHEDAIPAVVVLDELSRMERSAAKIRQMLEMLARRGTGFAQRRGPER